jgi:hypothetical protein
LDGGYDPSDFTAFCERSKGADIDNWTFEELQGCVREFREAVREIQAKNRRTGAAQKKPSVIVEQGNSSSEDEEQDDTFGDLEEEEKDVVHGLGTNLVDTFGLDISDIPPPPDYKPSKVAGCQLN